MRDRIDLFLPELNNVDIVKSKKPAYLGRHMLTKCYPGGTPCCRFSW